MKAIQTRIQKMRLIPCLLSGCSQNLTAVDSGQCPQRSYDEPEAAAVDFTFASLPPKGWQLQVPGKHSAQRVEDPVNANKKALRFELLQGERVQTRTVSRPRSEIYEKYRAPFGRVVHYQFQVYIPDAWQNADVRALITQWHGTPDLHWNEYSRSPNLGIEYRADRWLIRMQSSAVRVNTDNKTHMLRHTLYRSPVVEKNRWHQFDIKVRWSYQHDGLLNIHIDNQQVVDYQGPTAYNDCFGPYFKMGIYRDETPHTFVIYHNNYRRWLE